MTKKEKEKKPYRETGERVNKVLEALEIDVADLIDKTGISRSYAAEIVSGAKGLSRDVLIKFHKFLKVNADWLLTGDGEMFISETSIKNIDKDCYKIPIYNIKAAAGDGYTNEPEKVEGALCFRRQWVQTVLLTLPENLFIIQVAGDSMEPTFRDGDMIAGDKSKIYDKQDGIYVIRRGDELMVKRLQFLNGKYRVLSDNTLYPPYETKDIALIGKVVWFGRKL